MKKILLVHTDEIVKSICNIVFSNFPWEFLYVKSGAEAINVISNDKPDMVILDLSEGTAEVYNHLRTLNTDDTVPVLQICSKDQTPISSANDLFLELIYKPFSICKLTAYIKFLFESELINEISQNSGITPKKIVTDDVVSSQEPLVLSQDSIEKIENSSSSEQTVATEM